MLDIWGAVLYTVLTKKECEPYWRRIYLIACLQVNTPLFSSALKNTPHIFLDREDNTTFPVSFKNGVEEKTLYFLSECWWAPTAFRLPPCEDAEVLQPSRFTYPLVFDFCGKAGYLSQDLLQSSTQKQGCLEPAASTWRAPVRPCVGPWCHRTASRERQPTSRSPSSTPLWWACFWSLTTRCAKHVTRTFKRALKPSKLAAALQIFPQGVGCPWVERQTQTEKKGNKSTCTHTCFSTCQHSLLSNRMNAWDWPPFGLTCYANEIRRLNLSHRCGTHTRTHTLTLRDKGGQTGANQ